MLMSKKQQAQAFLEKKKAKVKKDCGCNHG